MAGETPAQRLDNQATLARYLFQSKQFKNGRGTYQAFMPPPDLELSTFVIDGLLSADIWSIGRTVLERSGASRGRLYGRADIKVAHVTSVGLTAVRDDDPERHVKVIGWDQSPDADTAKAAWKMKALELAAESVFAPSP